MHVSSRAGSSIKQSVLTGLFTFTYLANMWVQVATESRHAKSKANQIKYAVFLATTCLIGSFTSINFNLPASGLT
jgi:hypothetical protein